MRKISGRTIDLVKNALMGTFIDDIIKLINKTDSVDSLETLMKSDSTKQTLGLLLAEDKLPSSKLGQALIGKRKQLQAGGGVANIANTAGEAPRTPEQLLEILLEEISKTNTATGLNALKDNDSFKTMLRILPDGGEEKVGAALTKRFSELGILSPSLVGGAADEIADVIPPAAAVTPAVARAGIGQKISEIYGKAQVYVGSLSPTAKSRALKGILVGAGLIGASGLTYAAWSNLSAGDGADALTQQTIRIKEIIDPIWEHDVSPWTLNGGSLKLDITEADKTRFTRNITDAVFSNNLDQLTPKAMADRIVALPSAKGDGVAGDNITYDSIMESDADYTMMGDGGKTKGEIINASEQLISIANEIESNAAAVEAAEDSASKASATEPGTSPTTTPPISTRPDSTPSIGGSSPSATSDSGYESSSLIMKERGYLKSVQSSWTQEFDTAFRAFIDAGTAKGAVPTNLVGGQEWSDVAGPLGFSPNKSGAFSAIISVAGLVDKKTSTPTTGVATPAPSDAPASTTPDAAGDNPVLAAIIGAMYNTKLVGTPGLDFIGEPKRIRALIESAPVGGPNPTGYGNAARIIMKMNPAIGGMLPAKLTGPVDDKFVRNPANKSLLQTIQVAINGIYESAIPALVKPGLERSRELIARYLNSAAGGNWTVKPASNSVDQWVKLASERKMRIRAEIAAEMTPAEMAAARRIKMREI
jgi:hypothetical protein